LLALVGCDGSPNAGPNARTARAIGVPVIPPVAQKDTLGLFFRESSYVILKNANSASASEQRFHFGVESAVTWKSGGMFPLKGDFNGNGGDSVGVYCRRMSRFMLGNRNRQQKPQRNFIFEPMPGWGQDLSVNLRPVMGDWDGDGIDTVGLYEPAGAQFYIRNENKGDAANPVTWTVGFVSGANNGRPLAGDWNGDGFDTLGVYDPITRQFSLSNTKLTGSMTVNTIDHQFTFGAGVTYPFAGDFDGDGEDTIGVFSEQYGRFTYTNNLVTLVQSTLDFGANLFTNFARQAELTGVPQLYPLAGSWVPIEVSTPGGFNWPTASPESVGIDPNLLSNAYDDARSDPLLSHLHSLLVVCKGKLVGEEYFRGYTRDMANNVKSVSKSVISALIGIAITPPSVPPGGPLIGGVTDNLGMYFPESGNTNIASITLHDLMTMTAGLQWKETNDYRLMKASTDWADFVLSRPVNPLPPEAPFRYSTGNTQVGAELLERVSNQRLRDYADSVLWSKLGINCPRWDYEPNAGGIGMGRVGAGGHELYLRPRDMAVFGELYRLDGTFNGTEVVKSQWVQDSIKHWNSGYGGYGYWWRVTEFNGVPVFHALGHAGQHILIAPSKKLVVVMTSHWSVDSTTGNTQFTRNLSLFKNGVLPAVL